MASAGTLSYNSFGHEYDLTAVGLDTRIPRIYLITGYQTLIQSDKASYPN